jgi:hypothetical protein
VAAVAGDQDVAHAAAAAGRFAGRFTQARFPAHLRLAGPQLVTEWAVLGLILEHRDGHLNDHALTSSDASTTTMTSAQRPVQVNGVPLPRPGAGTRIPTWPGQRVDSLPVFTGPDGSSPACRRLGQPMLGRYSCLPDPPRTRLPRCCGPPRRTRGWPTFGDLGPGLRELGLRRRVRDMFGHHLGGLHEGVPGLVVAPGGCGYLVPLNLPSLVGLVKSSSSASAGSNMLSTVRRIFGKSFVARTLAAS